MRKDLTGTCGQSIYSVSTEVVMNDLENGFFVRLYAREKEVLKAWASVENRSMTSQATTILQEAIIEYRKSLT